MAQFTGQLRPNEIFGALFNFIISQQVFSDNIAGTYGALVDAARIEGSLYGDSVIKFATDCLEVDNWLNDAEAQNLLKLHRPRAPKQQVIVLDQFRQIRLTIDNYLSKRVWSGLDSFSQFTTVMQGWIGDTKKIYDSTTYNAYIGTTESAEPTMTFDITLPSAADPDTNADLEALSRLAAQEIARRYADLLVELKDVSIDFNEYGFVRSYDLNDLVVVWNSDWKNTITKVDTPTIYHDDIFDKVGREEVLPARYFGTVNSTTGTTSSTNTTVRAAIEKRYTIASEAADKRARRAEDGTYYVYCFAGDLLPNSVAYLANETYTVDPTIAFKLMHKDSVPYMSAFSVATSFFNARSLTETQFLTYGHNTLDYMADKPFITARAVSAT